MLRVPISFLKHTTTYIRSFGGRHPSLLALQQDAFLSGWASNGKFIKCEAFASGFQDLGLCRLGKAQSTDRHFRHFVVTSAVRHGGGADGRFSWVLFHVRNDCLQCHRRTVTPGEEQTTQDFAIEVQLGAPR